jgi:hypothetical protein
MTTRQELYSTEVMIYRITITRWNDDHLRDFPFAETVDDAIDKAVSKLIKPGRGIVSVERLAE